MKAQDNYNASPRNETHLLFHGRKITTNTTLSADVFKPTAKTQQQHKLCS